jgi:hypothetical protein
MVSTRSLYIVRPITGDRMPGYDRVLDYHSTIIKNREFYFLQLPHICFAFFGFCQALDGVGRRLQTGRDQHGKTYVSLIPFLLILERQAMNAFEALASCRSYEAWVTLRPGIEATLIASKWVENPDNARIWASRNERKTEYIKTFSGKGLVSDRLPRSQDIKAVLDRLNDEFVHSNEPYYSRHTTARPVDPENIYLALQFFDDSSDVEPHGLAFLHLLIVLVDSWDQMMAAILPSTGSHHPQTPRFEAQLKAKASPYLIEAGPHNLVMRELGLWPETV